MKILILEDSQFDYNRISNLLVKVKCLGGMKSFIWAQSHSELVKLKAEGKLDDIGLVFADMGLPDIGVNNVVQLLKKEFPSVPLIVLTGLSIEELDTGTIAQGAEDFLSKQDLSLNELTRTIRYSFERSKLVNRVLEQKIKADLGAKAKSDFLSNMSHEIRTPLNIIVGTAEILNETKLSVEQQKYVDTFIGASDHLLGLINDILDFTKIESDEMNLINDEFSLQEVLEEVSDFISYKFRTKKLEFDYSIEPESNLTYSGDKRRIFQILLNLINNGLKFTEKGHVHVLVKSRANDHSNRKTLIFRVEDTGPGISEKDIQTIFTQFYQVEDSLTKVHQGTGLGLAIVQKLLKLMGGKIDVQSQVGKGTAFEIEVPFSVVNKSKAIEDQPSLSGKNYLLATQSEFEISRIKNLITAQGGQVEALRSGQEVLAHIKSVGLSNYDRIFLDVVLLDVDAFEVIEKSGMSMEDRSKCIVLLPSAHRKSDMANVFSFKLGGVVTKPVRGSELNIILSGTAASQQTNANPELEDISGLKILVVEDDEDNRNLVQAYLSKSDCEVKMAESGQQALNLLETDKFDVILMDIQMPEMDGFSTAQKVRELEVSQNSKPTAIVGYSANAFNEDIEKAKSHSFSGYISKPVKKATLIKTISNVKNGGEFYASIER